MLFDFDTLPNRRESDSEKWGAFGDDKLPMWVADMDFKSPDQVLEILHERINHGVFGYAIPPKGVKDSVVEWLFNRHEWAVQPEDLIFIPGVVVGFNLAAHAVTRPGDGVILQTPTYGPFFDVAGNVNLLQQESELRKGSDGQYRIDFDAFEACITGRSKIFMMCNPQNPTGRVFQQDELEKMAEICLRHKIIICSDEIHSDLVFSESKHLPIAKLSPEIASNTITLIAPSKTFNLAGLKISIAIISDKNLRKRFKNARKGLLSGVNILAYYASLAAYRDGAPWLTALLTYLEDNRDYLHHFIHNELPGITMTKPEGTFLAWLDCRHAGIPGKPSEFFKANARVVMNDGERFGKGGEGFVRLNFGCPRSMLEEALEKMKEAYITNKG